MRGTCRQAVAARACAIASRTTWSAVADSVAAGRMAVCTRRLVFLLSSSTMSSDDPLTSGAPGSSESVESTPFSLVHRRAPGCLWPIHTGDWARGLLTIGAAPSGPFHPSDSRHVECLPWWPGPPLFQSLCYSLSVSPYRLSPCLFSRLLAEE